MTHEPFRPGFHFSPPENWMNDPNGLVWYDGEYHLFYQYNPEGTDWGNMSWGHAVSPDLVRWTHRPVALEFTDTEHVFSGSVVVDHADTSGLGTDGGPAMVALYTAHHPLTGQQTQALAWSTDRGVTWARHPGNPVLDIGSTDFRDPKVFWYEPGGYWVMAVALPVEQVIRLYSSGDLLSWAHLSDFSSPGGDRGLWECPDLFELPVDGGTRWVLVFSLGPGGGGTWLGTQYVVGDFDGVTFIADPRAAEPRRMDHGADCYAAVSFSDAPAGQRILVGWMNNWTYAADIPTSAFRGSMTVPRIVTLKSADAGLELVQEPVSMFESRRDPSWSLSDCELPPGATQLPPDACGDQLVIRAELAPGSAERVGLRVRTGDGEGTIVGYDVRSGTLYVDRRLSGRTDFHRDFAAVHTAPMTTRAGLVSLTVLVDRASVEVFGNNGEASITDQIFPNADSTGVELFAEGGSARAVYLTVDRLTSVDQLPDEDLQLGAL
jgi:fructan beta-fructosidase